MGIDVQIKVTGFEELRRKLGPQLFGKPVSNMLRKAGSWGLNKARGNAPADLYGLKTSLTLEVDRGIFPGWSDVYSNAQNARPMEYGAGLLSDAPDSSHRRFFPPGPALDGWAARHGWDDGWAVARAIYRRGGLTPRRFLRDAWEELATKMDGYLREMAAEIQKIWQQ